jgi:hypothetical protein
MLVTVDKRQSSKRVSTVAKRQNVGVGRYLQRELQSEEDRKKKKVLMPAWRRARAVSLGEEAAAVHDRLHVMVCAIDSD